MKQKCDHPSLLIMRIANDITKGMEGIFDFANVVTTKDLTKYLARMIQDDDSMGAPSYKITILMALMVSVSILIIPQLFKGATFLL
jgi:hypothetical protein